MKELVISEETKAFQHCGKPVTSVVTEYSITSEGNSADVVKNFANAFLVWRKLENYQLKLHVNRDIKPVASNYPKTIFKLKGECEPETR